MTDLIPIDAAIAALNSHAHGTTTLGGQTYRSITLEVAVEALRAVPAIDPAAIREAAVEMGDLGDDLTYFPTLTEHGLHTRAYELSKRILALIGEKK